MVGVIGQNSERFCEQEEGGRGSSSRSKLDLQMEFFELGI